MMKCDHNVQLCTCCICGVHWSHDRTLPVSLQNAFCVSDLVQDAGNVFAGVAVLLSFANNKQSPQPATLTVGDNPNWIDVRTEACRSTMLYSVPLVFFHCRCYVSSSARMWVAPAAIRHMSPTVGFKFDFVRNVHFGESSGDKTLFALNLNVTYWALTLLDLVLHVFQTSFPVDSSILKWVPYRHERYVVF